MRNIKRKMYIEQIYTNCLSQYSYYIESQGEVAIIDPMREPSPYLKKSIERKAKVKYIFETHFHSDFVSGHLDIADKTNATIVFGPNSRPAYPAYISKHNETFALGNCKIKLLHTPGHTLESSCILLIDENNKEHALFTGDTLLIGDIGKPDLLSGSQNKFELTSMLFDSLNNIIMKLDDETIIYPGHGVGSKVAKKIANEKSSTIKQQKLSNYAMQIKLKENFVVDICSKIIKPPTYFYKVTSTNIIGYNTFEDTIKNSYKPLTLTKFLEGVERGALILDTRDSDSFAGGFIKNSINIGLNGSFCSWVGMLIDMDRELLLITDPRKEKEALSELAKIGHDNIAGYLEGGIESWKNQNLSLETIECVEAENYKFMHETQEFVTIDLRSFEEIKKKNICQTISLPLEDLYKRINEFRKDVKYLLICNGGYRSIIAASILKSNGILNITNINGGILKMNY